MALGRSIATLLLLGSLLAGCATHRPPVPANVTIGGRPHLPAPRAAANSAPPQVLAGWFSTLDLRRGMRWRARFVTSSNVASIEVRTNLFSIDVPRCGFGCFAFHADLLDVPPIFIRPYALRVIARNSAGTAVEEDLPFRIR